MSQPFGDELIDDLFAEAGDPVALLVTLEAEGLAEPLTVTNHPGDLGGGRYGLQSRGADFEYFPFGFVFPGAGEGEPVRDVQLEIANTDGRIAQAVRLATGQPTMTVELVRVADPDTVELAVTAARVADAEIDGPRAIATLKPRDFDSEPACQASYIAARTPGLY